MIFVFQIRYEALLETSLKFTYFHPCNLHYKIIYDVNIYDFHSKDFLLISWILMPRRYCNIFMLKILMEWKKWVKSQKHKIITSGKGDFRGMFITNKHEWWLTVQIYVTVNMSFILKLIVEFQCVFYSGQMDFFFSF